MSITGHGAGEEAVGESVRRLQRKCEAHKNVSFGDWLKMACKKFGDGLDFLSSSSFHFMILDLYM